MAWVLDLDGVIWLGEQPIVGSAEAVARLRAAGETVLFATNNSSVVVAEQEAKLARIGIPAEGALITSAMAGAALVEPGQRVLVCGGPGVVEALEQRGAVPVRDETDVDVLMVGFHRDFDYERLRLAAEAVRRGARFVATNDDATYPTPDGPIPGGGAIAAAIAYAVGRPPEVAGKPHQPMADLARARAGEGARDGIMVGDRPDTDGAFAATLGYRFGLVLTGVVGPDDLPVDPTPDAIAPDLATLVTQLLGQ
ncbi:MAG TPA: HAD-IIA family hydrolase [Acidimicrobiales bacterium]|nr:HAD-IIA family hydrolase [Acidimicrobiales bacterium]